MDIRETLKTNVKRIRKSRGMTQREFAEKADISHYTIINLEQGKTVSLEVVEQIANAYEIDPAELVSAEAVMSKPLLDTINIEAAVADNFNALPPFKQTFYQAMAVKLDKCYDEPLNGAYDRFKADVLITIKRTIEGIDIEGLALIEVKRAAIKAVEEVISSY